jgi:hypothetical protein
MGGKGKKPEKKAGIDDCLTRLPIDDYIPNRKSSIVKSSITASRLPSIGNRQSAIGNHQLTIG